MKLTLFHLLFNLVVAVCTGVVAAYPMPATGTPVTLPIPTSTPVGRSPDPSPLETPVLSVPATLEIIPTSTGTPNPTATVPVYAYGPAGFPPDQPAYRPSKSRTSPAASARSGAFPRPTMSANTIPGTT